MNGFSAKNTGFRYKNMFLKSYGRAILRKFTTCIYLHWQISVPSNSELFTAVLWPICFRENRLSRACFGRARIFWHTGTGTLDRQQQCLRVLLQSATPGGHCCKDSSLFKPVAGTRVLRARNGARNPHAHFRCTHAYLEWMGKCVRA